ncbi:MAG: 3 beta-hydroxysteroid dehydrogenase/Delta 5--_4-isomerase [Syntrophus sp. PtaU1.Bin208]|nr:MAG: 3 beta-hydroxysteroid dehydrogenase/Delta 5-->4-isomerase [Syntrophus sp. PtaU1.Bin208]
MRRSIAITGATGFVGGVLLTRLAAADWRIRALFRPGSLHKRPSHGNTEWIPGDLEDGESLRRLVAGVDAVVHCAGIVRGATRRDFEKINVEGAARLVSAAREQYPEPRFFFISSLAAREPHLSHYAASKRKGERTLAADAGPMPWVIFRPTAVYGPGDRELLPVFRWMCRGIAPVIGSPGKRISLLYVEDLAEAVLCCLKRGADRGRTYEVHDGHAGGYSWEDIIDVVARVNGRKIHRIKVPLSLARLGAAFNLVAARLLGRAPMLTPGKVNELVHPDWVGDNAALTGDTGWLPRVSLEEGLRQTLRQDGSAGCGISIREQRKAR